MSFFDGLTSYEIVLLVLGVVLFLVILAAFLTLIIKGKPYSKLLPFFVISVVMIGYTKIQSISYQNGVVTITNVTPELQQDPTNTALRQQLQTAVAQTASRHTSDPDTIAKIATAQYALGDLKDAEANLSLAQEKAPQLPAVAELQQKIELDNNLTKLTAQVTQNPQDQTAKAQLQQAVASGSSLKIANPVLITHLAGAQLALGNSTQATALNDQALKIQPDLAPATALKQQMLLKK